SFARHGAEYARQVHPHVVVLAGISTQPSGQQVTADDILRAIAATRYFVDGYWFNIPAPSEYCPRCTQFRPGHCNRRAPSSSPLNEHAGASGKSAFNGSEEVPMRVIVLGGDGFCGWPTSLHLSARGH